MKPIESVLSLVFAVGSAMLMTGCADEDLCWWKGGTWTRSRGGYERCVVPGKTFASAAPGDVLYVTATAHVTGALGTNWRSDVEVHNLSGEESVLGIWLLEHGVDNSSPERRELSLAAGRSLRLGDVLTSEFGLDGQAALLLSPTSGRILVTSRTYNLLGEGNELGLPAGATFGQYIPSLGFSDAIRIGEQGRLIQLSHSTATDGGARANLGLVNSTGAELRVKIQLFTADGELLGTVNRTLLPYEYEQINRIYQRVTDGDVTDGYAVLNTSTPGGAFFAYASIVDNLTGDPVAISAARLPGVAPVGAGDPVYVAAAAHTAGAAGTNWRTDLELHCWGDEPAEYVIELLEHGKNNGNPTSEAFTLPPGESIRFRDILDTVFAFEGAAALRITPTSGRVLVTSRTYNLLGEGNDLGLPAGATFGQFIPGVTTEAAIGFGEEGRLIQLSHSTDDASGFRTNLVLVNATAGRIDTRIDLFTADGSYLGRIDRSLKPFEYRQLNRVFASVTSENVDDGYALVRTMTEGGAFFALASVVDNLTGDPVGMGAPVILSAESDAVLGEVLDVQGVLAQTGFEGLVDRAQMLGVAGLFDGIVAAQPDVASRTADGMVIDYGDGYAMPDGTIRSGSITVDASGLSVGSDGITGAIIIAHDQLLLDGEPPPVGSTAWTFNLTERTDGTVAGDITVAPAGRIKSLGSLSGAIGIDTAICLEYPISGSLTAVVEGEEITITFRPNCDGRVEHEVSPISASGSFSYNYASPNSPDAQDYVASTSNAEVALEGTGYYWRSIECGETLEGTPPGVITMHFPFDSPIVSGRLFAQVATFHWSYSRGHIFQYGSTDGVDWQLLAEVEPPDFGLGRGGGWNGELPEMFIGATDLWLETRLYAYGPNTSGGAVYCNTAQMSRWDPAQTTNTFELEVELE